jgi:hypothetical protein
MRLNFILFLLILHSYDWMYVSMMAFDQQEKYEYTGWLQMMWAIT